MEICMQCPMCGCYFSISGEWKSVKINEMGDIYWQSHLRTKGTEHRCTRVLLPTAGGDNTLEGVEIKPKPKSAWDIVEP